jgi:S1-C subfamily serine protease
MAPGLAFAVGVIALLPPVDAQEAMAPATVDAVKKATVFIRVEGDGISSSGSGFVIAADGKSILVATNHHVVARVSAAATPPGAKPPVVTVVFDSGQKGERVVAAEIAAIDPEEDLAVLRVPAFPNPPKPIAYSNAPRLAETMPVYSFGFPFGDALATGKGSPAITVGKASISSLRNGDDGGLEVIQIDGNLNPGNSGGPVVDARGQLVGVAMATIRDGQGIGLVIPSAELGKMMQGRIGRVRIIPPKDRAAPAKVRIEAELIDPALSFRSASAHYFIVPPKTKRPEVASLNGLKGSTRLEMSREKGKAVAEFTADKAEGEVLVQVVGGYDPGRASSSSPVRTFSLAPVPTAAELAGPPPAGWKEYTPRDKTFVMWVPERPAKQSEQERNPSVGGQRMRVNSLTGKTTSGLEYSGESVLLPATFARVSRKELYDGFRAAIVEERRGRVIDSTTARLGNLTGAEYTIESVSGITRVRMFVAAARIYIVEVHGTADLARGTEGETILSAYRISAAAGAAPAVAAKGPNLVPVGKEPTIIGGRLHPASKDVAPPGALLVGLEVVIGKPIRDELIQSVRPIYRVGDKESFGQQFGTDVKGAITIKAKAGYAIGAMSAKARNVCDGFSVTFMKVVDGKLDSKDSYESDWIGWNGSWRVTKVGGDGTPVIGVAVKIGNVPRRTVKDVTGLGLVFKGQEAFNPQGP